MTATVHKLPNFRRDLYLSRLRKAFDASEAHEHCIINIGEDGPYSKIDIAHERGYREGLNIAMYLYKRRFNHE